MNFLPGMCQLHPVACLLCLIAIFSAHTAAAQFSFEEALDGSELSWTRGGTIPWETVTNVTHDGTDAASARPSWPWTTPPFLETTFVGPGSLSFWWKISSDTNRIVMRWFLDGVQYSPNISGEIDWTQLIYNVGSGIHTARWQAVRLDYDDSIKTNRCWLDQVAFTHSPGVPAIVRQPASQVASGGGTVTLNTLISGGRPQTYQWFRDNVIVVGATNATLTLTNLQLYETGSYQLLVTNVSGAVASSNAMVTVLPVVIEQQPVGLTVVTGRTASFYFYFDGYGPFSIQWRRDGIEISNSTNQWFELPAVGFSDAGAYTVTVSNSFGVVTSAVARLTVVPDLVLMPRGSVLLPAFAGALDVVGNFAIVGTADLSSATNGLFVVDISSPSAPALLAKSGPNFIPNVMVSGRYVYTPSGQFFGVYDLLDPASPKFVQSTYSTPAIHDVTTRNGISYVLFQHSFDLAYTPSPGDWLPLSSTWLPYAGGNSGRRLRLVGTNAFVLSPASLEVYDITDPRKPILQGDGPFGGRQFCVVGEHAYIAGDTNGLLVVNITNPAAPWLVGKSTEPNTVANDVDVSWPYAYVVTSGGNLRVFDVREPTTPGFVTEVWSDFRRVRTSGRYVFGAGRQLQVLEAIAGPLSSPTFRQQPLPARRRIGGSNIFSATITGEPPLHYQWFFNNTALPNATNWHLTVTNIDASKAGIYHLVATNGAGFATSTDAVLTLVAPPEIVSGTFNRAPIVWDNSFTFTFMSQTGIVYAAEYANTPAGPWAIGQYITSSNNVSSATLWAGTQPHRYFRVRALE